MMKQWLFLIFTLVAGTTVNATVIDFESATTGGCQVTQGGTIDGFTLGAYDGNSGGGFNNATSCNFVIPTANSGSQFMLNYNSVIAEFTRNLGTFTLNSLFVHSDNRVGATVVRFQGLDGVNGNVLHSMDVNITNAWQQIVFAGWTNVKTFTWDSLNPNVTNIAIDDFNYTAIPEPSLIVLFSAALLAFRRQWQK